MGKDKRALTVRLPENWRQDIWNALSKDNRKLMSAVAVLQLTGCRPKELNLGVTVAYMHDHPEHGEVVALTIIGAKTDDIPDKNGKLHQRGQPERTILVSLASEQASFLADLIMDNGGKPITVGYHLKSISTRLGEASRKVFPKRREHVSAYCYRHSFSSDQKSGDVGRDKIASAMGQLSDFSQGAYQGKRRDGSGTQQPPILDATSTRPVKHNKKTDKMLKFKMGSKFRKSADSAKK